MRSAAAIVLLLSLAGSAGAAGKREDAKRSFKEAEAAFGLGRFEEALAGFTRAYELAPHPSVLFNIAQCHRNLRNYERAIFFLERYLGEAEEVEDRRAIERLISDMERQLRTERVVVEQKTKIVTTTITSTVTLPVYVEVEEPIHTKGWFWGLLIGAVAVAGGAIAIGFAVRGDGVPDNDVEIDLRR
jgi:tetratricopeptide (TPR) repeat protein